MEEPNLEQRLQPVHPDAAQHPENDAQKTGTIDDKVSQFSFKSMLELGLSTALGIYTGGVINYLGVLGAYTAAHWYTKKSKTTKEGLMAEAKTSGLITAILANLFKQMAHFQSKGATMLGQYGYAMAFYAAIIPVFNLGYHAIDYLYKSGKSMFTYIFKPWKIFGYGKELYEKRLKEEYIASTKSTCALIPFIPGISVFAPMFNLGYYKIALSSVARFFYRLALGSGSKDKDADARTFPQYLKDSVKNYLTWPQNNRLKREDDERKAREEKEKAGAGMPGLAGAHG
ncbi:hypothetical protein J4206_02230 [Candidatus Woesearchaeota archaeon]|nr:hypothetical protein [Candidatus Woesearchaeota archaeon]